MEVGVLEAKNRLSELIERAERGEKVVITRHGKAVVSLIPEKAPYDEAAFKALMEENAKARAKLPKITREDIAEAIRAGRRF